MDELLGDTFENCNFLCEVATFEHYANHDPQPRKCSEILNCDINKFMFICSECDGEFENAEDYYVHQMLQHQDQKSHTEPGLDTWYEQELLEEFLQPQDTSTPQVKEFYETIDKIIDMDEANAAVHKNENIGNVCDYLINSTLTSPDSGSILSPSTSGFSDGIQSLDSIQINPQFEPLLAPIDAYREPPSGPPAPSTTSAKITPERKRKKKRTPGQCDICHRSFNDTYNLRIHKMIHTGEMPFQCEECGKGFRQYNKLKIHSIIHTNKKPFVCDLCGKGFRFRNYLAIHKRLHTGEKPYKCKFCDEHFHSLHNRRIHVKAIHMQEQENFICTICGKSLSTKCYLQVHMRRHNNQRDFKCDLCEKAFFTAAQLKEHLSSHEREKPHQCEVCLMTFEKKINLSQHVKIHSDMKSYTCRICNITFAQNAGYFAHMKTHEQ